MVEENRPIGLVYLESRVAMCVGDSLVSTTGLTPSQGSGPACNSDTYYPDSGIREVFAGERASYYTSSLPLRHTYRYWQRQRWVDWVVPPYWNILSSSVVWC
ncbi:hypothetical protein [Sphaerisporangium sp. NPDC051011]|uniref:hypothetical protein n=1 Tax=Sphaerisporangium sp. NPDC051011 TaxID=3155792 RepID=UPI0033F20B25